MDDELIRRLVDAHLVRGEFRGGAQWYELAHDRLIAPVRASNRAWFDAKLHKVQKVAALWESQGRPDGMLLLGADLEEARQWARTANVLTETERRFLRESEEAQAARNKLRQWAIAASAAFVLALIGLGLALMFSGRASEEASRARASETESQQETRKANWQAWIADGARFHAGRSAAEAERQRAEALLQRSEAESQRSVSDSRRLGMLSTNLRSSRLDIALLVALEAVQTERTAEAVDSLARALESSGLVETIPAGGTPTAVAYSPDGKWLAVGTDAGKLTLLDVRGGASVSLTPRRRRILQIAFDATGELMASSSLDGTIVLRDMKTGEQREIRADLPQARFALSPNGRRLAVIDRLPRFRDIATGAETAMGDQKDVVAGAFGSRSERRIPASEALGGSGTPRGVMVQRPLFATVRLTRSPPELSLWDGLTGEELPATGFDRLGMATVELPFTLNVAAFSPVGDLFAAGGLNGNVLLWDFSRNRALRLLHTSDSGVGRGAAQAQPVRQAGEIWGLAFRADGKRLASGSDFLVTAGRGQESSVVLWDTERLTAMRSFDAPDGVVSLSFSADGSRVAGTSPYPWARDRVAIWDALRTPDAIAGGRVEPMQREMHVVALAADGARVASVSDGGLALWNARTGRTVTVALPGRPLDIAYSPDGELVATVDRDNRVRIRSAGTGQPQFTTSAGGSKVMMVAVSRQAARFATIDVEARLTLHDGDKSYARELNFRAWGAAAFSLDGTRLALGVDGAKVIVWDVQRGLAEWATLSHSPISAVALSPDGKLVATGGDYGERGVLALWNADTAALLKSVDVDGPAIHGLAFSADGRRLASLHADRSVRIWDDVSLASWQERGCRVVRRNLCAAEWRQWIGSGIPYRATCPKLPWPPPAAECDGK